MLNEITSDIDTTVTRTSMSICDLVSTYSKMVTGKNTTTYKCWSEMTEEQQTDFKSIVASCIRNPARTPSEQHERWLISKITSGWTYGKIANADKKQHPNIVHWELLPNEEQFKDAIFCLLIQNALR